MLSKARQYDIFITDLEFWYGKEKRQCLMLTVLPSKTVY